MSHIFPRHTKQLPPVAARGEGCYLYDTSGKQWMKRDYVHVAGKYAYDRRLKNLDKLSNNRTELLARKEKIVTELRSLQEQAQFINGILKSIQRPAN